MNVYTNGFLNGIMTYWDEVEEAARYYVHLMVHTRKYKVIAGKKTTLVEEKKQEIAVVEEPRNIKYHSFAQLAVLRVNNKENETEKYYSVYVEAEDRNGTIIAKSKERDSYVYIIRDGYYYGEF